MIYLIIGGAAFLLAVMWAANESSKAATATTKRMETLGQRQEFIDKLLKICEGEIKALQTKLQASINLNLEVHNKLAKEQDFMRAHQHGMDKRIAGLKREVVVNVNGPLPLMAPEKPNTKKPNSLLKRAGVTQ